MMQPTDSGPAAVRSDTLALLYQGILTGIVRIQSKRQPLGDPEIFRKRMKAALQDVDREGGLAGYGSAEIRDAEFAVVAFLDETILSSKEARAEEWRKKPLNIDLFGQAIAGDVFYDKLIEIERRRDSPQLADLLEVYLLCLLLGFEGRFAPPLRGEVYRITERLRGRIESIRAIDYKLSPPMEFRVEQVQAAPAVNGQWRWWVLGSVAAVIVLFLLYLGDLSSRVTEMASR